MCLYCEGKYQIVLSKAVVLLSWSAHEGTILAYTKAIVGKNCLSSHSCHFVKIQFFNQTSSCLRSMCLHCEDIVLNYWIKSCGRSWWAHEGTIFAYTKAILGKKCLSSRSCNFVIFFFNQIPSCICSMHLQCRGKVSNCCIKSCGRSWSAHKGTVASPIREKLSKFS